MVIKCGIRWGDGCWTTRDAVSHVKRGTSVRAASSQGRDMDLGGWRIWGGGAKIGRTFLMEMKRVRMVCARMCMYAHACAFMFMHALMKGFASLLQDTFVLPASRAREKRIFAGFFVFFLF